MDKNMQEKILEKLNKEVYYEEPYKTWAEFKEHENPIEEATGVKNIAVLIEEIVDIAQHEGHDICENCAELIFDDLDKVTVVDSKYPLGDRLENGEYTHYNYGEIKKKWLGSPPQTKVRGFRAELS
jgi:hypothetical protein